MKTVEFKDLAEGAEFTYNNIQLKKISPIKVSCCTSLNAVDITDPDKKTMIRPLEKVEVNE